MTIQGRTKCVSLLNNPEYLGDLLTLTPKQLQGKWGVGRNTAYNHLNMSGAEIRKRIGEVEHG